MVQSLGCMLCRSLTVLPFAGGGFANVTSYLWYDMPHSQYGDWICLFMASHTGRHILGINAGNYANYVGPGDSSAKLELSKER